MNESDLNRLRDMLDHARQVMDLVKDETREALEYDIKLFGALCWSLSIVGEAAPELALNCARRIRKYPGVLLLPHVTFVFTLILILITMFSGKRQPYRFLN